MAGSTFSLMSDRIDPTAGHIPPIMTDPTAFLARTALALISSFAVYRMFCDGLGLDLGPAGYLFGGAFAVMALTYARGAWTAFTTPRPDARPQVSAEITRILMLDDGPTIHFSFAVLFGCAGYHQIVHGMPLSGIFTLLMTAGYIAAGHNEIRKARERAAARRLGPSIEQIP